MCIIWSKTSGQKLAGQSALRHGRRSLKPSWVGAVFTDRRVLQHVHSFQFCFFETLSKESKHCTTDMAYIQYIYIKYGEDDRQPRTGEHQLRTSTGSPLTDRIRQRGRPRCWTEPRAGGQERTDPPHSSGGGGQVACAGSTWSADPPLSAESCSLV